MKVTKQIRKELKKAAFKLQVTDSKQNINKENESIEDKEIGKCVEEPLVNGTSKYYACNAKELAKESHASNLKSEHSTDSLSNEEPITEMKGETIKVMVNSEEKGKTPNGVSNYLSILKECGLDVDEALRVEAERISRFMDFLPDVELDRDTATTASTSSDLSDEEGIKPVMKKPRSRSRQSNGVVQHKKTFNGHVSPKSPIKQHRRASARLSTKQVDVVRSDEDMKIRTVEVNTNIPNLVCMNKAKMDPEDRKERYGKLVDRDEAVTETTTELVEEEKKENHGKPARMTRRAAKTDDCEHVDTQHAKNGKYQDPGFIKYLSEKELMTQDEHPELTGEQIRAYLYDMWIFSEDYHQEEAMVKDADVVAEPKKETRRRTKRRDSQSFVDNEVLPLKEKPVRKRQRLVTSYYAVESSETDSEVPSGKETTPPVAKDTKETTPYANKDPKETAPPIAKDASDTTVPVAKESKETIALAKDTTPPSLAVEENAAPVQQRVDYADQQWFEEEFVAPMPNPFKGLLRERLCEICLRGGETLRCRGVCGEVYHADCVRKKADPEPTPSAKKKRHGRPKKTQDGDKSEEAEPISVDAQELETRLSELMASEMDAPVDPDLYSTDEELDWEDVAPGTCVVQTVVPRLRRDPLLDDPALFRCNDCTSHAAPRCFVCQQIFVSDGSENRTKCGSQHCHKTYHPGCLSAWPQTRRRGATAVCPRHVCHTCVCDDPRGTETRFSGDKLARCVYCPAAYHALAKCLPAGSKVLNASFIVCPRHYRHANGKQPPHVNTAWCFICATGGSLICCESCPTSFHADCLGQVPPEGGYVCEDCETGRLPLPGELVWAKLGHYRWWPGAILPPHLVPVNVAAVKHDIGEFCVRFLGGVDHYWMHRGRVFPYQEGDTGRVAGGQRSKIDAQFLRAVEQARRLHAAIREARSNQSEEDELNASLLPPHYVKLRVNKPVGALAAARRAEDDEGAAAACGCLPTDFEPCSENSQCLNRALLTECGPGCAAGDRCHNRAFEKRQYPKLAPRRTAHRGWGLHALQDIKKGQFVIEYVGELIDTREFARRMQEKHDQRDENYYFLTLDSQRIIDAGPKGNVARFMNHSCEPNCGTQKWTVLGDVRVGLFALDNIPAGSECTFNYNLQCATQDKKRCVCGAPRCAGYIGAKPKQDEPATKKVTKRKWVRKPRVESPSTSVSAAAAPRPRTSNTSARSRQMTELEQDLAVIKNAMKQEYSKPELDKDKTTDSFIDETSTSDDLTLHGDVSRPSESNEPANISEESIPKPVRIRVSRLSALKEPKPTNSASDDAESRRSVSKESECRRSASKESLSRKSISKDRVSRRPVSDSVATRSVSKESRNSLSKEPVPGIVLEAKISEGIKYMSEVITLPNISGPKDEIREAADGLNDVAVYEMTEIKEKRRKKLDGTLSEEQLDRKQLSKTDQRRNTDDLNVKKKNSQSPVVSLRKMTIPPSAVQPTRIKEEKTDSLDLETEQQFQTAVHKKHRLCAEDRSTARTNKARRHPVVRVRNMKFALQKNVGNMSEFATSSGAKVLRVTVNRCALSNHDDNSSQESNADSTLAKCRAKTIVDYFSPVPKQKTTSSQSSLEDSFSLKSTPDTHLEESGMETLEISNKKRDTQLEIRATTRRKVKRIETTEDMNRQVKIETVEKPDEKSQRDQTNKEDSLCVKTKMDTTLNSAEKPKRKIRRTEKGEQMDRDAVEVEAEETLEKGKLDENKHGQTKRRKCRQSTPPKVLKVLTIPPAVRTPPSAPQTADVSHASPNKSSPNSGYEMAFYEFLQKKEPPCTPEETKKEKVKKRDAKK